MLVEGRWASLAELYRPMVFGERRTVVGGEGGHYFFFCAPENGRLIILLILVIFHTFGGARFRAREVA